MAKAGEIPTLFRAIDNKNLDTILGDWEKDRSSALLYLLGVVQGEIIAGYPDSAEAAAKCALVLYSEPLIVDKNSEKYDQAIQLITAASFSQLAAGSIDKTVVARATYVWGLFANAQKFCPDLIQKKYPQIPSQNCEGKFYEGIQRLRKINPSDSSN